MKLYFPWLSCVHVYLKSTLVRNSNHWKTNEDGEPELHYIRLPRDIANDYVVLMDPIVGTGSAAMMAIRVLLDHDVKEDKIILVSLLMAECGSQGNLKHFGGLLF